MVSFVSGLGPSVGDWGGFILFQNGFNMLFFVKLLFFVFSTTNCGILVGNAVLLSNIVVDKFVTFRVVIFGKYFV